MAAIEMAKRLEVVNIKARSVELPAKDAAEFMANGGRADAIRKLIAGSAGVSPASVSAAHA